MKSIIIYYSFSGGTHKIAHSIYKGISQLSKQCDIVSIKGNSGITGMKPADLLGYDLIGFGSPVWFGLPPRNMMTFVANLPYLKEKHTFVFFTHGTNPTRAPRWMVKKLKEKRSIVIGWNDWYGGVYTCDMFKPYYTDGHPDEIDLNEARDFGVEMVVRSEKILKGESNLIPTLPKLKEYIRLYGYKPSLVKLPEWSKHHHFDININKEKCNKCQLCVENCPTGSINLSLNPPVNGNSCINCTVCEQICPLGAVEVDHDSIAKSHEAWGKRWERVNFFNKAALRIAADPRFRRHVPLEDVGKSGAWYQISKHPRIKLPK